MQALVIYYSLEGNTAHLAQAIGKELSADLLRLQPSADIKSSGFMRFLWGGRQVMSKAQPELQPYELDLSRYTHLFIGTPVWANSYAPALRTFLESETVQNKQIGLFCCYGGAEGKCLTHLRTALTGNTIAAQGLGIRDPLKHHPEAGAQRAAEWSRWLVDGGAPLPANA